MLGWTLCTQGWLGILCLKLTARRRLTHNSKTLTHACAFLVELWGEAGGSVRSRAAPRRRFQAAPHIARGMVEDDGVKRRAVPRQLEAIRTTV